MLNQPPCSKGCKNNNTKVIYDYDQALGVDTPVEFTTPFYVRRFDYRSGQPFALVEWTSDTNTFKEFFDKVAEFGISNLPDGDLVNGISGTTINNRNISLLAMIGNYQFSEIINEVLINQRKILAFHENRNKAVIVMVFKKNIKDATGVSTAGTGEGFLEITIDNISNEPSITLEGHTGSWYTDAKKDKGEVDISKLSNTDLYYFGATN